MLRGRAGPRAFDRVVIVSALSRSTGIASGARLQWQALRRSGVDAELVDAAAALRDPRLRIPHRPGTAYVFHSAGPTTACLIRSVLPQAAAAYRIAYWAWELPDPPADWIGCDRNVSEIWTPSAYAQSSLSRISDRPVNVVPHTVTALPPRQRAADAPFTVLTMADSRSSFTRKNPSGALQAFRQAFGTSPSARLLLKLSGNPQQVQDLEASFGDLGPNVEIIRGFLDPAAIEALYRSADVLLSLHRAEGFGLPMLEAMAHGVPVVATGWSGNLEFMDASDSRLVPYTLIPVKDAAAVYGGGPGSTVWADPSVESAALLLRRLAEDPCGYQRLATAAHRRVISTSPSFPFPVPGCTAARQSGVFA
jgi:glycosyltransferase involved in cell wall biosynthesis